MEEEFKNRLSTEQYRVLREKGTEAPFSGRYLDEKSDGMYKCVACGQILFSSDTKFDSGTGWPSFDEAVSGSVEFVPDETYGMHRTEVVCSKCKSHLGHVFDDLPSQSSGEVIGPARQDGKLAKRRYCINSVCLDLDKNKIE